MILMKMVIQMPVFQENEDWRLEKVMILKPQIKSNASHENIEILLLM